jgi:hypothetical protein
MANPTFQYGPNMYSMPDQPGGIYKWWNNMGSDLFANLPGLLCAVDPKRCQDHQGGGGNGQTIVVKENNYTWLYVLLGLLVLIIVIILIRR